ncbi:hypothetical protein JOM56_012011, partial [Amanita muscaria]
SPVTPARAYEKNSPDRIGFGRYQLQLFILSGWFADNLWFQGVAVALPQAKQEFNPTRIEFTSFALYAELIAGAMTWGVLADLIGRRLSFNVRVAITSIANSGALFLEHMPQSHQWLLTLLSARFGNFSCDPSNASMPPGQCQKEQNMGWRYNFYTFGGLNFIIFLLRFIVFDLQESSKCLIAKGRDEEAIEVLRHLARRNGRTITLTLEKLQAVQSSPSATRKIYKQLIKISFSNLSLSYVTPLFRGRKLAINTTITFSLWALIGLAYPLFNAFHTLYLGSHIPSSDSNIVKEGLPVGHRY